MRSNLGRITTAAGGAVAFALALVVASPHDVRAADDFEKIHAAAGRTWYEQYCTPCHGAGGAPGSAVYADTKQPVDLRRYVARHDGKFPAARWIAIVETHNPALPHTDVWQRILHAQSQGGPLSAEVAGRALLASIASYVRSIQQ